MASNSSYPSPGSQDMAASAGPFYTGELDLAAKLSRAAAPLMVSTSAEDQQTHHALVTASHVLTPSRPVDSPQQLAQDVMSLQTESYDHSPQQQRHDILIPESSHIRKRSKVSRACDECRRKKTRCNVLPHGPDPCVGCKRSGAQCLFSRQPLKRGPSKGYIRHLSDRLATLERTLGTHSTAIVQAGLAQPSQLAAMTESPNSMPEYPTSQLLYDRMERLEGRIEEMLSHLVHTTTKRDDGLSHPVSDMEEVPVSPSDQVEMADMTDVSSVVPTSEADAVASVAAAMAHAAAAAAAASAVSDEQENRESAEPVQ